MEEHEFGVGAGRRPGEDVPVEGMVMDRLDAGGNGGIYSAFYSPFFPPARRWGSQREVGAVFHPLAGWAWSADGGASKFFMDTRYADPPRHFLDACTICRRPLAGVDIFMYTGMAFCSVECRQKRIVMDECRGKNASSSNEVSASPPRKEQRQQKRKASQDIQVPPAGTVMAG